MAIMGMTKLSIASKINKGMPTTKKIRMTKMMA